MSTITGVTNMKRIEWNAEVKKALTLKQQTYKDMAKELGVSHDYIRQIMCGIRTTQSGINKISKYLNIYPYEIKDEEND